MGVLVPVFLSSKRQKSTHTCSARHDHLQAQRQRSTSIKSTIDILTSLSVAALQCLPTAPHLGHGRVVSRVGVISSIHDHSSVADY